MQHLAGIAVRGLSVGGFQTTIELPGHDLALDMGASPRSAVGRRTVLFSHAHVDHMGAVAAHCATRALLHQAPPTYIVPPQVAPELRALLDIWRRLDGSDLPCEVLPLAPGEEWISPKRLIIKPFQTIHPVASQGYTIYRQRQRLRADLVGRPREAITQARARGEPVSELVALPEVAFSGDTRIDALEQAPDALSAKLLIMELTFYDHRVSVAQAHATGHIHLDEVIERAHMFKNQAILFTHRSQRWTAAQAQRILDHRLPQSLRSRAHLLG